MQTNGFTITLRQQIYFQKYCQFKKPVVTQLVVLQYLLKRRECLYLSINEMVASGIYTYWKRRPTELQQVLDRLAVTGFVVKSSRSYTGRGDGSRRICIWGLTGKGKAFLKEYYAFIEGERDHILFNDMGEISMTA